MEMSYGGTLVMPKSYAVMDQEEMCYVEGGATYTYTSTAGSAENHYTAMYWMFSVCSSLTIAAGAIDEHITTSKSTLLLSLT